ncbi:uncharacterized protein LOC110807432 isoform X2 [Carica papaya]|uniref:uncharacterized protein LOC110807432 isoform X2 n=1 Tax=Carica papaya TaxID=3649 RepID=UPI000B8C9346|nr:uncharacterized protein LOC110807432 isoform X2 [Carica papaya]
MSVPEMDLFRFLKLISVYIVAALVVSTLNSVESRIYIHFDQTPLPFSRFSTAIFGYSVKRLDGSNACAKHSCLIYCELDGKALESCPVGVIALRNLTENRKHQFLVNVTTRNGETNSSAFSWFIDTTPPTATISSDQNYTNAEKITIEITFTEACTREGAFFKCLNSSNCDVIARGPGHIHASSLRVIEPKIKYRLDVILSLKTLHGRVMINTKDRFCIDLAGNRFTRTNSSILVIHLEDLSWLIYGHPFHPMNWV